MALKPIHCLSLSSNILPAHAMTISLFLTVQQQQQQNLSQNFEINIFVS